MSEIRIKICGVTTAEDARFAANAGAHAIGLNFYPQSPRFLSAPRAAEIVRALPPFTTPIGIFVEMPLRQVCAVSYQLGLRGIQTYSNEPQLDDPFPFAHIPAFRIKLAADLEQIRRFIEKTNTLCWRPAAILLDAHVEGSFGGSGRTAPWSLLASFTSSVPIILAGGLTSENVEDAIKTVKPWGVDVASGVESSPGKKDPAKVERFIAAVRKASRELLERESH